MVGSDDPETLAVVVGTPLAGLVVDVVGVAVTVVVVGVTVVVVVTAASMAVIVKDTMVAPEAAV